jgi:hypothetical protein
MSNVDSDLLGKHTHIPSAARDLLAQPERKITFHLNLKLHENRLMGGKCHVVHMAAGIMLAQGPCGCCEA